MTFTKHIHAQFGLVTALLFTVTAQAAPLKEINWVGCGVSKAAFMQDLSVAYEKKTGIRINIDGGGATRGIREVASGKAHLGGSCRLPLVVRNSDGTFSVDVAEKTVKMIPLGWDALVVIAHPNNPVTQISEQQLRDVYTGKMGCSSRTAASTRSREVMVLADFIHRNRLPFNSPHSPRRFRQAIPGLGPPLLL